MAICTCRNITRRSIMKTNNFNIYVMSYKRSDAILSKECFEYCTYCVRKSEEKLYRDAGITDLLTIPDEEVHDFMSTFYWILNNTPEEVVFIADDDIKNFLYRTDDCVSLTDKETITSEIERIAQVLCDLNLGLAYDNPQKAPYVYDKEYAFKGMPGHIRWVNKNAFKARYNVEDPASSDIDMAMQEMLMNRIILLTKYFLSSAMMDTNKGIVEDRSEHIAMTAAMKCKWAKYYNYDYRKNTASINVSR